jgi:hypothetical protein
MPDVYCSEVLTLISPAGPLSAAGVGKAVSPGSGADDVGGGGSDYFIKCPQCHKGYPGFQALKEHVESSHPSPPHLGSGDDGMSQPTSPVGSPAPNTPAVAAPGGGYACSQCSTSFLHKDQLEKHELLHSPNAQVVSTVQEVSNPVSGGCHSPIDFSHYLMSYNYLTISFTVIIVYE